jgi:hypothetical protein
MRRAWISFIALAGVVLTVPDGRADLVTLPTTYNNLEPSNANMAPTVTVGGLTFSDFSMVTGSGGPAAMDITVRPVNSATEPGLEFDFSISSSPLVINGMTFAGPTNTVTFGYTVQSQTGIGDALLKFAGSGNRAAGALPTVQKTLTFTDASGVQQMLMLNVGLDANDTPTQDQKSFEGVTMLTVTETAQVTSSASMSPNNRSSISSVTDSFSSAPEPATLVQAVIGILLGLGYAWRCRRRTVACAVG